MSLLSKKKQPTGAPLLVVIGTRPEAIKLAPVVLALRRNARVPVKVCLSGQHRDLLTQGLSAFDLTIDHSLDLMTPDQRPSDLVARVITGLTPVIEATAPAWLVVQGDTTTALGAALAGFHARLDVAHVEAGLRSGDRAAPWPEEMNRRLIGQIAALHFAPTERARANLLAEGVAEGAIEVTGNTVIDALHLALARIKDTPRVIEAAAPILATAGERALVLVPIHRRESLGEALPRLAEALLGLAKAEERLIVLPIHPNPRLAPLIEALSGHPGILLTPALDYLPFVALLHRADLILTDSGGIQEEASALGKPVLVLRDTTERPELVAGGNGLVVGTRTARILDHALPLLTDPAARAALAQTHDGFGDGHAAERIAQTLENRIAP
ncbi:non-hydrolyzing UDP-N-acetylglucosamine 2-epimerase [Rhodospirillum rubrum]|uniref:non-hydrolyzing UDP-N-acetylglucosamine 2-epimerase n=1 Tax=Rhodospirillum rubrum TaxID=1085 RepID=UPI0028AA3CDF|nr:UDP-N-acetylglucosamine 2-epimerase (non-hydrolyzing) [Rhodospirillum rubrum]